MNKFLSRLRCSGSYQRWRRIIATTNMMHTVAIVIIFMAALVVTLSNLGLTKSFIGDDAGVSSHFPGTHFQMAINMWDSFTFPGRADVVSTFGLVFTAFDYLLSIIGLTANVVDRISYCIFLFFSGLGMFFLSNYLCHKLFAVNKDKLITLAALAASFFYMFNNFTMILFSFPPTNYIYSYVLLPWIFLLYLKNFHISGEIWRKVIFAFVFLLILCGNPANSVTIIGLLIIYEIFFRKEGKITEHWKSFTATIIITLSLSIFIFLPMLFNPSSPYGVITISDIANAVSSNSILTSLTNLFQFRGDPYQGNYIFNGFLTNNITVFANYLLLIWAILPLISKKRVPGFYIYLCLILVIYLFLSKSEHAPLAEVNTFLYAKIPFFGIFRANYYKFVYPCVFATCLLLSISLIYLNRRIQGSNLPAIFKWLIWVVPLSIILYNSYPFFVGQVAVKFHKTEIPDEYQIERNVLDNDKTDFSILSLPQMPSGMTLDWGDGNYFASGGQPDCFLLNRPVWNSGWFLQKNEPTNDFTYYKKMIAISNIKYVILHKDIPEEYNFDVNIKGYPRGQTNFKILNEQISADKEFKLVAETQYFKLFEIKQDQFLPHIYVPSSISVSEKTIDKLFDSADITRLGVANLDRRIDGLSNGSVISPPTIEIKKVSPTKYKVVVHGASAMFPLVFNESYQAGWKLYQTSMENHLAGLSISVNDYKILEGNSEDQATDSELIEYINKGLISTLGNGMQKKMDYRKWDGKKDVFDHRETYSIDFISKNYQGTIQNNNLNSGKVYDTWFKTPIPEENHMVVNGYANGWVVDPKKICSDNTKCLRNPDGTYDLEFIMEFWPQRMFYLGLIVSGTTILLSFGAGIFLWRRNRNK